MAQDHLERVSKVSSCVDVPFVIYYLSALHGQDIEIIADYVI